MAVAMDAGGIPACKPFYEGAKAAYARLVDPKNALSEAFGFKVIPNGFLIDEAGVVRAMKVGGFEVSSPSTIRMVEEFLSLPRTGPGAPAPSAPTLEELKGRFESDPTPESRLVYARALLGENRAKDALPHLESASNELPKSWPAQFALGSCLLALDRKAEAVPQLRKALKLDPENYVIRKQIWLIEHPEKFHPTIDWGWQREQLKKEREAEKNGGG